MPIRTNRGRAAVYRRLWGWPLRSPRHLIITAVGLAVFITVIGILLPENPADSSPVANESTITRSAVADSGANTTKAVAGPITTTTSTVEPVTSPPLPPPPSAAPAPQALAVAEAWVRAWVDHPEGITTQQWLEKLKPHTTDEYLGQLASVDPRMIPATKVTGRATPSSSTDSSVDVTIPTDNVVLKVMVIATSQGWRVAGYSQAS